MSQPVGSDPDLPRYPATAQDTYPPFPPGVGQPGARRPHQIQLEIVIAIAIVFASLSAALILALLAGLLGMDI